MGMESMRLHARFLSPISESTSQTRTQSISSPPVLNCVSSRLTFPQQTMPPQLGGTATGSGLCMRKTTIDPCQTTQIHCSIATLPPPRGFVQKTRIQCLAELGWLWFAQIESPAPANSPPGPAGLAGPRPEAASAGRAIRSRPRSAPPPTARFPSPRRTENPGSP